MQSPQSQIKDITRLLGAFPSTNVTDPDQNFRNYITATEDYTAPDLTAAVDAFLKGQVPGFDGRFAPTAPMLATACRRALDARVDRENRQRSVQPRLPPPDIVKTPEERARVKAKVDALLGRLVDASSTDDAERDRRRKDRLDRTNERFDRERAEMDRELGYSVGVPQSDGEAA